MIEKINITIPVFNRITETISSITALKKNTTVPYTLNVVDNGSDLQLVDILRSLYKDKIIDNILCKYEVIIPVYTVAGVPARASRELALAVFLPLAKQGLRLISGYWQRARRVQREFHNDEE